MRKNSYLAVLVFLVSGCAQPQPERVYVNLDRVLALKQPEAPLAVALPKPGTPSPPVIVKQPGLPASSGGDQTLARLEAAKKLIEENRGKSIASLSSMLQRVYLAQAEDEIAKRAKDVEPEHGLIRMAALERLKQLFEAYGQERGPLLARLNVLARSTDLTDQPLPERTDGVRAHRVAEANTLRGEIRKLDGRYDAQATALLDAAQKEIESEIAALRQEAKVTRTAAEEKAHSEAEKKATETQTSLDVKVKQLLPENLPAIGERQVTIPGSAPMSPAPTNKSETIFGSLEQRRRLLNQEIEIWIKTSGKTRSLTPKGVPDATEEFLQWRSAHKVGP